MVRQKPNFPLTLTMTLRAMLLYVRVMQGVHMYRFRYTRLVRMQVRRLGRGRHAQRKRAPDEHQAECNLWAANEIGLCFETAA